MSNPSDPDEASTLTLDAFQPNPNALYSLDVAAHLAGVPRRSILIYCRAGLVHPVLEPPSGIMSFTEEAIYTVRRIEHVRAVYKVDVPLVKTLFDLLNEVERLRAEVRFLRNQ